MERKKKRDIFNSLHVLNIEVLPLSGGNGSAGLNESICSERGAPWQGKEPLSPLSSIRKRDSDKHRNSHLDHLVTSLCFLHLVAAAKLDGEALFQPLEEQKSRVPTFCLLG